MSEDKYKLRTDITKDFLNECKFNVSGWTPPMKAKFQQDMFYLGIFWSEGESKVQRLTAHYYFTRGSSLQYDTAEEIDYFQEDTSHQLFWDDIFEPVNSGVKLDEDNFNKHVLSESLPPEELVGLVVEDTTNTPHKSDGGSSKYYQVVLPQWLLDKQSENGFIMIEDLAEVMFDNDFNYTNIFKAQKRMFDLQSGGGKVGNTLKYDANKCKYYTDKQVEVFNRTK